MSALKRFLDRDSVAKAVVVTALSMAALAAAPAGMANPPPNAGSAFSAPGRVLVALDMEARRIGGVARLLDASTRRCLEDQGRMLAADGAASGDPAATASALDRRAAALSADRADDPNLIIAHGILAQDDLSESGRRHLLHHAGLRETCLAWADRSIEMLRERIGAKGPDLSEVKGMAERDAGYVRFIAGMEASNLDRDAIEAMETYGPRP